MLSTGKTITIFGGTGFVGRYLVSNLIDLGIKINILSRRPEEASFLKVGASLGQISIFKGSHRNKSLIEELVKNSDAIVNLTGILHEKKSKDFKNLHTNFPAFLGELAAKYKIKKFIHISALSVEKNSLSKYAVSKFTGENLLKSNFQAATIIRPSVIFGAEDNFFNKFAKLMAFSPFLPVIGNGKTKFQPVYVDDVANAIVKILSYNRYDHGIYEIGGPDIINFAEIMQLILDITKRNRMLLRIPFPAAYIFALFAELLPDPLITRDQLKLMRFDNVTSQKTKTLFDLGIQPKSISEIVPSYLEIYSKESIKRVCNS
jgi:uncharacterized protein YbjT (DUF2867 family)